MPEQATEMHLLIAGSPECSCFPTAVPFWRVLLIPETEGTGMPQHCVDLRMCCSET